MAKPKTAAEYKAILTRKQADLDALDDQIMDMPEMGPEPLVDASPEFDLLTQKREELEEEIRQMREGVQFISEWEKLKGGQWSDGIKNQLDGLDAEIADIAGGEAASGGIGGPGFDTPPAPEVPLAPPAVDAPAAPAPEVAPEAAPPVADAAPAADAAAPALEPPLASQKSATSEKNQLSSTSKKGSSARSDVKKEGSKMANQTATKPTNLKDKLAELKNKRAAIKKEAQVRTAAAYTIANTMLPKAPVEQRQAFAASLLQGNSTKALVAALRQTAINAHYSKVAEQFKEVHKVEMNDLLEDPSVLKSERSAVEKEIKGDAKSAAAAKTADDRKDAGPQTETYNDGRGCGGGPHSEPKEMDASKAAERPDAGEKPGQTVNLSDGKSDGKAASAKVAHGKDCKGCPECDKKKEAAAKCADCTDDKKCAKHASAAPKAAACADCKDDKKCAKHASTTKKADEPPVDAPVDAAPDAPAAEEAPIDVPPMDGPVDDAGAPPAEAAGDILTDEKKMIVQEQIDTVKDDVRALEQELGIEESEEEVPALALEEGEPSEEELDLSSVFDQGEMEDKAAALANEGEEHTAGEDDFFAPTSAAGMEAALEDSGMQVASIEDYFNKAGSSDDPLYSLIASDEKVATSVEGWDVLESFTGEVANKMKQNEAGDDARDNEQDHDEDLFVEAMKDIKPEQQGAKRTPQDCVPELQSPKSASDKTAAAKDEKKGTVKRLKNVQASAPKSIDIASALFGDEF